MGDSSKDHYEPEHLREEAALSLINAGDARRAPNAYPSKNVIRLGSRRLVATPDFWDDFYAFIRWGSLT
jgi:hypothetical protein